MLFMILPKFKIPEHKIIDTKIWREGLKIGFIIKFADSSHKISHQNSSIYFGSRIINSVHISNSYTSVPKMIPKEYRIEDDPIENRHLKEFRQEYYENVEKCKDFSEQNINFLNNLLKE